MSRRDARDSDSKRRHSRFDRELSPKRSRRDERSERERNRVTSSANLDNGGQMDRDQKNYRRLHDVSPLEAPLIRDSKQEAETVKKNPEKKPNDHHETSKHSSDATQVPRSRTYFQQHDERGSAGQNGRRATGERGWWKDSKDQHNERVDTSHSRELRDEKSQGKLDNSNLQRKNGFSERKDDPPPTTKKRPAFREKKTPVDPRDAKPAATEPVKSSQIDSLVERKERREERSSNPRHSDRPEKQYAGDRASNWSEPRKDGFLARGRYGGSGGNSNYRGRDRFNGRQGFRPIKTHTEKWKHDLYQDVNEDPKPKNDDDQIAKLEALLAS